jgi:hypothetical protein
MSLPDLTLQIIYARLAWGLVTAAVLLSVLPSLLPKLFPALAQRSKLIVAVTVGVIMVLPGAASPAYWLTLVFQYPSGLMAGYSLVALFARWTERPVNFLLHPAFALLLTVLGVLLYLDAFGVLALGLYYRGFDADVAGILACVAALAGVAAVWLRFGAGGAAMLTAALLFSLLRLPSGNLWDALLDPLLWAWALGSVVAAGRKYYLIYKARQLPRQAVPEASAELVQSRAGSIE